MDTFVNAETAAVVKVETSDKPVGTFRRQTVMVEDYFKTYYGCNIEACPNFYDEVLPASTDNALVQMLLHGYSDHYPVRLTPDSIWLCLIHGLARHINLHAEDLRSSFVSFQDKKELIVIRDEFQKGYQWNPWEEVYRDFSLQIKEHVGAETHSTFIADFSTSTTASRAASEVILMDAMKSYFNFTVMTRCGIPYIEIAGTIQDWESMLSRVESWSQWGLDWWIPHVKHVLLNFILALEGKADTLWWQHILKDQRGSGTEEIHGWVNWLIPYLKDGKKNPCMGSLKNQHTQTKDYGSLISNVPFKWSYHGTDFPYQFMAGFAAVDQDPKSGLLSPMITWAVAPASEKS